MRLDVDEDACYHGKGGEACDDDWRCPGEYIASKVQCED